MSLIVSCLKCGKKYKVGDDKAGKKIKCAACGAIMTIPAPVAPELSPEVDVDLWDLPAAEDTSAPRLPELPQRSGTRQKMSKPSKSSKKSSSGMPTWLRMLLIVLGTVGGFSVLTIGGIFAFKKFVVDRTPSTKEAIASITWTKYADQEAGFEAEYPNQNIKTTGEVAGKNFLARIPDISAEFRMGYTIVGEQSLTNEQKRERLKEGSESFPKKRGSHIAISNEMTIGEYPAHNVVFTDDDAGRTMLVSSRNILVKDRIYLLMVVRPANIELTKETERFFNSFRILEAAKRSP